MTTDAGEVFKDLIAEYETAQRVREHADSPTPHSVGQFWMNNNTLYISALGPDGKTITWLPLEAPRKRDNDPPELWV